MAVASFCGGRGVSRCGHGVRLRAMQAARRPRRARTLFCALGSAPCCSSILANSTRSCRTAWCSAVLQRGEGALVRARAQRVDCPTPALTRGAPRAARWRSCTQVTTAWRGVWGGKSCSTAPGASPAPAVCVRHAHPHAVHQQRFHAGVNIPGSRSGEQLARGHPRAAELARGGAAHRRRCRPAPSRREGRRVAPPALPPSQSTRRPVGQHQSSAARRTRRLQGARLSSCTGGPTSEVPARGPAPSGVPSAMAFAVSATQVRLRRSRRARLGARATA